MSTAIDQDDGGSDFGLQGVGECAVSSAVESIDDPTEIALAAVGVFGGERTEVDSLFGAVCADERGDMRSDTRGVRAASSVTSGAPVAVVRRRRGAEIGRRRARWSLRGGEVGPVLCLPCPTRRGGGHVPVRRS
ncbi:MULTISPECIES: hypothetical protein [unclassified Pseudonocardia]|uniref:hypothetical protein n=1 Tax=unclassified Pseudonocardia TaxID=2619320 RepID=UPI0011AEAB8F|nr:MULTISPECIES: hypothetical protein [unclassified Pseudonocardia]